MPQGVDPQDGVAPFPPVTTVAKVAAPGFAMPQSIQIVPAASVIVPVTDSSQMAAGQTILVGTAGYLSILSVTDATHIVAANLGYTGNAAFGAAIPAGANIALLGAIVLINGRLIFPVNATDFPPHNVPTNPAEDIITVQGQSFQMGGTVAIPTAYTPIFHVWPRDPARGPFSWTMGTGLSFTTFDPTMLLGYNGDLSIPAEPSAFIGIEGDYEYVLGSRQCEMYFQFGLGGTGLATGGRPVFTTFNRATACINTTMDFGSDLGQVASSAGFWTVTSRYNGNAITVTDDHVYVRRNEFGVFLFDSVTSAVYLAIGHTGAGGINIYDQPIYGGQRRFTTGNAKPDFTFAITTIIDPAAKAAIRAIVDALKSSGYDMVLDHTT